MKKLFLFIALICFVLGFNVDSQTINMKGKNFDYHEDSEVAGDSVLGIAVTEWTIRVLRGDLYRYDIYFKLDSAGDATNVNYSLWGKNTVDMDYKQIGDSSIWYMNDADTTIRFNNITNLQTVSSTVAQHTVTVTDTVYHSGTSSLAAFNMWSYDSLLYDDTTHVDEQVTTFTDTTASARIETVAAQTITTTVAELRVGWGWLMIKASGAAAGTKAVLERLDVAIIRDD